MQFVCHSALEARDKVSAFGVEREGALGELGVDPVILCPEAAGPVEHVAELPVGIVELVIDGEYTAEDGFVAPVEHITGVGTYLEEA